MVKVAINQEVPLRDAAEAHRALEGTEDHGRDGADAMTKCRFPWQAEQN